ncbi:hypothetical protein [Sphingomonas sp.]|uniref:hypothetical protein n=1 Tax=Sphingomonas sp. TaxID=28214 RepID=UPI003CC56785
MAPLLLLITTLAIVLASSAQATPACPPTTIFTTELDHLDGYRVFVSLDGDSAIEPLRIDARRVPMLNTGKVLKLLTLPGPGARPSEIVVGPPNVELPLHPAPVREMFILLGGSFTLRTARQSIAMVPGSVLLFDDVGARLGHGGHIGPCGYISLSIAP